jgi:hypothetical protein
VGAALVPPFQVAQVDGAHRGLRQVETPCHLTGGGTLAGFPHDIFKPLVEAINGNIRMLINRSRGYKNMRYLLLKAKRIAVTNTEYVAFQKTGKAAWNATSYEFLRRALF